MPDRKEYQRAYYQETKDERLAKLHALRAQGWTIFSEMLTHQRCERCGRATGPDTQWRHRDLSKDTQSSFQNLADVRLAARSGYSEAAIKDRFSQLIPLCPPCSFQYNPAAPEKPDASMLTHRQQYERSRKKKSKAEAKAYRKQRVDERKAWLRAKLDQPCAVCQRKMGVTWHVRDIAFDSPHERRNLAMVRNLCTEGAAFERIEQALNLLHPLCPACYRSTQITPAWKREATND